MGKFPCIRGKGRHGQGIGWEEAKAQLPGFWAEFEGEEVGSYEDTRSGKSIVYTLYKCTAYNYDAYRVHVADESNPASPVYDLLPKTEDPHTQGVGPDFSEPWQEEQVVAEHPMFVRDLDYLPVRQVDPLPRGF
jgi:hypothetical protein